MIKETCGSGFFCLLIWLPLICFSLALSGVYYSVTTTNCSPLVLKGYLPKPAQQFYGVKNVTSWYYGEWRVMPDRGACPLHGRTTGKSASSHSSAGGDYANCLSFSESLSWELMDKYNQPVTSPSMADSAISMRTAYQALLAAIFVSLALAGMTCTNIYLSINSRSGRHSMFSLFLLLELLAYFLVFLLATIVVGLADSSSISAPVAWASWFPKCTVVIAPLDIPGFMIFLLDLGLVMCLFFIVGELTHRYMGGCLTRFFGPVNSASGFTKTLADVRTRHVRVMMYGADAEGLVEQPGESSSSDGKIQNPVAAGGTTTGVDVIPKKLSAPRV